MRKTVSKGLMRTAKLISASQGHNSNSEYEGDKVIDVKDFTFFHPYEGKKTIKIQKRSPIKLKEECVRSVYRHLKKSLKRGDNLTEIIARGFQNA